MIIVNKGIIAISSFMIFVFISCNLRPEPIHLGKDACSFCKMSIANQHFGAEIITKKGKVYKFDDMHCIVGFMKSNTINSSDIEETWLINFDEPHNFIPAEKALLLKSNDLHSPMGGNIANFSAENDLKEAEKKFPGQQLSWSDLLKQQ